MEKPYLISMFGFGWVKTHLRVVFGDAFGLVLGLLVGFLEKWIKIAKFGQVQGPTQRRRYPTQRRRSTLRRRVPTQQHGREGELVGLGLTAVKRNYAAA